MKKTRIFLLIFPLAALFAACSDFLNTEPQGMLQSGDYYKNNKNLEAALAGVYDMLGSGNLYGGSFISGINNDADEAYYYRSTYTVGPYRYNHTSSEIQIDNIWKALYYGIARANMLLHFIPEEPIPDAVSEDVLTRVRGEAMFLRAYFYFLLVQNFGRVPFVTDPYLKPENMEVAQSSVAGIYEFILTEMQTAEPLVLPIRAIGHGGRVNQSAVRGILARVCLNMAGEPLKDVSKYVDARDWAKKVMDDAESAHDLLADYTQVYINYAQDKYDIRESIWEVEFWGNRSDAYTETGNIGSFNGIACPDTEIGAARGFLAATGTLYKSFHAADLRRDWAICPFTYNSTETSPGSEIYITVKEDVNAQSYWKRYVGKFRREYEILSPKAAYTTPINFPLLRYSDVLLMFAEAENEVENGPNTAAYAAINKVRARGFGKMLSGATNPTQYDLSGMDKSTFFTAIVNERSWELCFEALRWGDLVRWGMFVDRMHAIAADIVSDRDAISNSNNQPPQYVDTGYNNVSTKHLLLPIPSQEMAVNRLLEQNPLW